MKKIRISLLIFSLLLCLIGCSTKDKETVQKEFNVFLDELPTRVLSDNSLDLEYLFNHPTDFGFKEKLLELPYSSLEDYQQSHEDCQEILKELYEFDYKKLSTDQQLTYDILKDYLTSHQIDEKFYYLDNSYLGSFIGFQAQLPIMLNDYTFEQENDLLSYFHILETAPEMFKKYGEMEKERLDQGVGMSQDILDKVIKQCENFASDDEPFLIETINKKIDQIDFYTPQQKEEAKIKNEKLLMESLIKAYDDLGKQLSLYKGRQESVGLAQLPNGKEYYEYLLHSSTGIDDSIEDIQKYLQKKLQQSITKMSVLALKNPSLIEQFSIDNINYGSFHSFEDNIDYLKEQMVKDYPTIENINYDVNVVPDSMKDNFSPAAYMTGKIDAQIGDMNHIWVNGDYDESLYPTLAHEGYPGHMYQDNYFRQLELPTIRYILNYTGYIEGWATYIENKAYVYADVSQEEMSMLEFNSINNVATQCIISLMDIGIHYEGWSYDDYLDYAGQYFHIDSDDLKEQYDLFVETPTNYLCYFLNGMKYSDLFDKAQDTLGEKFDVISFNQVVLDTGPSSYAILEKQVDQYIKEKRSL